VWWLGGIYSPNHQNGRWGGCLSMGAPDSPVRQPHHPTVRVLTVSTVGALTDWGTGQSSATSDSHCSLSGAPSGAALTLCALSAHCSRHCSLLQTTVCTVAIAPHGTPNSPVNYSGVALQNPKLSSSELISLVHRTLPVAHWTVRCARPGQPSVGFAPFFLNPNFNFLLAFVEPLAPVELII
jgi:hypothetical protein